MKYRQSNTIFLFYEIIITKLLSGPLVWLDLGVKRSSFPCYYFVFEIFSSQLFLTQGTTKTRKYLVSFSCNCDLWWKYEQIKSEEGKFLTFLEFLNLFLRYFFFFFLTVQFKLVIRIVVPMFLKTLKIYQLMTATKRTGFKSWSCSRILLIV